MEYTPKEYNYNLMLQIFIHTIYIYEKQSQLQFTWFQNEVE